MNTQPITYLFPFEKVPYGSKIILYGFGNVGKDYYSQLAHSTYCDVVAIMDGNNKKFENTNFEGKVCTINELSKILFDFIVVASMRPRVILEIVALLQQRGISQEKIICPDNFAPIYRTECIASPASDDVPSFSQDRINIAMLLGGGFGDYIVTLKVFEILTKEVPTCRIDIAYRGNQRHFAECVYARQKNLGIIFNEKLYDVVCEKYDLAITVEHFWIIDHWNKDRVLMLAPMLCEKIETILREYETYCGDVARDKRYGIFMRRCIFWGLNRYTALGHRGIFPVNNKRVHIVLEEWAQKAYRELQLPSNYITMNYGAGVIQVKIWPLEYMGRLAKLIHEKYTSIDIVQIGSNDAPHIDGMDRYVLGSDLEIVKYILKHSILHIDCEGGLVHLATQLGAKCCVLAGPTPMEYYGYEENINIVSEVCKECDDVYPTWEKKCMRGFEQPECMYSITPEVVLERTAEYLNGII